MNWCDKPKWVPTQNENASGVSSFSPALTPGGYAGNPARNFLYPARVESGSARRDASRLGTSL
jgi:hypothetical protein